MQGRRERSYEVHMAATEDAADRPHQTARGDKVHLKGSQDLTLQMWNDGPLDGSTPPPASSPKSVSSSVNGVSIGSCGARAARHSRRSAFVSRRKAIAS